MEKKNSNHNNNAINSLMYCKPKLKLHDRQLWKNIAENHRMITNIMYVIPKSVNYKNVAEFPIPKIMQKRNLIIPDISTAIFCWWSSSDLASVQEWPFADLLIHLQVQRVQLSVMMLLTVSLCQLNSNWSKNETWAIIVNKNRLNQKKPSLRESVGFWNL